LFAFYKFDLRLITSFITAAAFTPAATVARAVHK
jgi:hypothetical protein